MSTIGEVLIAIVILAGLAGIVVVVAIVAILVVGPKDLPGMLRGFGKIVRDRTERTAIEAALKSWTARLAPTAIPVSRRAPAVATPPQRAARRSTTGAPTPARRSSSPCTRSSSRTPS